MHEAGTVSTCDMTGKAESCIFTAGGGHRVQMVPEHCVSFIQSQGLLRMERSAPAHLKGPCGNTRATAMSQMTHMCMLWKRMTSKIRSNKPPVDRLLQLVWMALCDASHERQWGRQVTWGRAAAMGVDGAESSAM